MNRRITIALLLVMLLTLDQRLYGQPTKCAREKLLFDYGWSFNLGDFPVLDIPWLNMDNILKPEYNDSAWRKVDLPHDWAVELPFINNDDKSLLSHGYKPVGLAYPKTSKALYRKVFTIPKEDFGKRISIKFDGVYRSSTVWLNGFRLGCNLSGYSEFIYDVTDMLNYVGKNIIVVHVDASVQEGWFYEGVGIYRHTWLIKTAPLHIPLYGAHIITDVTGKSAKVKIETQVFNQDVKGVDCQLASQIVDETGKTVGTTQTPVKLSDNEQSFVKQELEVKRPELWSIERPYLYKLISTVKVAGKTIDVTETNFGIRTIFFDKDKGFFLNNKSIKIKGTCNHQDHAGVGSALPDRLQYYRIEKLKEMGCNAYRTAHHPPTPELLEACDRLGMLVCDENRVLRSSEENLKLFEQQIIRDRNHPSVIMWSIGNEDGYIQDAEYGKQIAMTYMRLQKELDPTRLCIYGANNANNWDGINSVIDIRGYNYHFENSDEYHKNHPKQVMMGSEVASTVSTRGQYFNDTVQGYVSDYDANAPSWAGLTEPMWKHFDARPYLAGTFVWTGFDYRGEPTPYEWPCISSHFGIMDVCGFPKNNYYYYQAWWSEKDVLHLFPHWNLDGKTGDTINVWCQTNCQNVELFLNGKSLGKREVEKNSHAEWKVVYEPGLLEAVGNRTGKILRDKVETTGNSYQLVISADRTSIDADGEDLSIITVTSVDEKGREVPTADDLVTFEITGNGKIIGVGNGNPSSHESDKILKGNYYRKLFNGKCQVIVQSIKKAGEITLKAVSEKIKPAKIVIKAKEVEIRPAL